MQSAKSHINLRDAILTFLSVAPQQPMKHEIKLVTLYVLWATEPHKNDRLSLVWFPVRNAVEITSLSPLAIIFTSAQLMGRYLGAEFWILCVFRDA